DPPRVPTENPTGDHLRRFDLPADWPAAGGAVLRLDGVESCASRRRASWSTRRSSSRSGSPTRDRARSW
ncbi:hypothetical protein, partial [Streptomyces venezuelae]